MSEMEITEQENDGSNDLMLLDRVFLRLGNADSDEQLESCIGRFLPPVILKLSSPHEQVRTKVMELLIHVNKRVKCRADVQLPVETLLISYKDPNANSFIINFSIIYITMGFPRLAREDQLRLCPSLIEAIEGKPMPQQDSILMLVMPLIGEIKEDQFHLKDKPKLSNLILKFATDLLLLPYRALPGSGEAEFQVPPGLSMRTYKRIVDKHNIDANQLEQMKLSIVNFLSKDLFSNNEVLLPLIVAAADSRFSVANSANSPLIRAASSVDWSMSVVAPIYGLYVGTWGGAKVAPDDRKVPACTRLRLKLIQYLNKATGTGIMFPHCVQVVFTSLFDPNSNARLRNQALMFLLNVINNGDESQLNKVASVFLQGLLKLIRSEEYADQHPKAYLCLGRLSSKCPESINNQFSLLEELVKKIPEAPVEMKTALRDAILEMAHAYKINNVSSAAAVECSTQPSTSLEPMQVDESTPQYNDPQALALFALLDHYLVNEDPMIRYIAMRYSASVYPSDYIPSRYLLLIASGDSQDDISSEALKHLYGTARPNEIENKVNNSTKTETSKSDYTTEVTELKIPKFTQMIDYVWSQIGKRKKGSNPKHRFVVNNQVLEFHPNTYQQILRYCRMCLNHDADLKDCTHHPNESSPLLTRYLNEHLYQTQVLEQYLNMITSLLTASPGIMTLTCFLDIIGCLPSKMSSKYKNLVPILKNLVINTTRDEIRETASLIYAIIYVYTNDISSIEKEIKESIGECMKNKVFEAQCGHAVVSARLCEMALNRFSDFNVQCAETYEEVIVCYANLLLHQQSVLVNIGCTNIGLLSRRRPMPIPDGTQTDKQTNDTANEGISSGGITDVAMITDTEVTKYELVNRLFGLMKNAKLPSRIKEKSLDTLGLLCCGQRFPFAKYIVDGFLKMAKDSKEFEIHLQIGESLVLCIEGVNSNESRDFWTELPKEGENKVKDKEALMENDELLEWLLGELFKIAKYPHPHSRQATSIWLLALLKKCPERAPIKSKLQKLQDTFMDFLSEDSEIVQDVASKGLTLVYQSSDSASQKELVGQIMEQLSVGRRSVAMVTPDTKIFEDGQLGKSPTGGNLTTYKELCSLASDLNQPDLVYKFMHLANHNSVWNSKKGAAFGFQSLLSSAGHDLSEQLSAIVPRLFRYRFDPSPKLHQSMAAIWDALVPNTLETVRKYHNEILEDLVTNLTSNQWRVRMSCCNGLSELLRSATSLHASLKYLPEVWKQLFRVMDDVHEGTRLAAANCATVLSKLCVRACDINQGSDGKVIVSAILPVLLDNGITNVVKEVRAVSLHTVSKLVASAGISLKPFLPTLIPALLLAAGELESVKLSYLSTALGTDNDTREMLDDLRANAARQHYTTDTVVKCMPFIDMAVLTETLPKVLELSKSPQLGTKIACCHLFVLLTHHLRQELEPLAGKMLSHLLNGAFDRNLALRKAYAEALGQVATYAKSSSIEKLMRKLVNHYETKEDEMCRSVIALILKSISRVKGELIKENENILAPMLFIAMHAPKDEETSTVEMFEEIWMEISPGRETGIKNNLQAIIEEIEKSLASNSWVKKIQASSAISTICKDLSPGLGSNRERLLRSTMAAAHGKTFDGKQHLIQAMASLCIVKENEQPISSTLADDCINALLLESRKQDLVYKKHAFKALGSALEQMKIDKFSQVFDIVKHILIKDETKLMEDSDDDSESCRLRREQLSALREASYQLLGEAWPNDERTQEKYREMFFGHCSSSFQLSSRSTQLAILSAMVKVIERLTLLNDAGSKPALHSTLNHVAQIIDYTLLNINQVRHRKDALKIMDTLVKKLKDLNYTEELNILKSIYDKYSKDLAKDSSHEIRTSLEAIKVQFK